MDNGKMPKEAMYCMVIITNQRRCETRLKEISSRGKRKSHVLREKTGSNMWSNVYRSCFLTILD